MNFKKLLLLGLPIVLFGCPSDEKDDTDTDIDDTAPPTDTDVPTDTDTDPPPEIAFVVELVDNPDQIVVTIADGDGGDYSFGFAQTQVKANGGDGWTGEDCYLGEGAFAFCHTVGPTGTTLDHVDTPGAVVPGSTTLLSVDTPASATPELTYYIENGAGDQCWVWGHDVTYYDGLGCDVYVPSM